MPRVTEAHGAMLHASPKQLGEEAWLPDGDELTLKVQRRIRWDSAGRATSAVAEPANRCRRISTSWSDRRSCYWLV